MRDDDDRNGPTGVTVPTPRLPVVPLSTGSSPIRKMLDSVTEESTGGARYAGTLEKVPAGTAVHVARRSDPMRSVAAPSGPPVVIRHSLPPESLPVHAPARVHRVTDEADREVQHTMPSAGAGKDGAKTTMRSLDEVVRAGGDGKSMPLRPILLAAAVGALVATLVCATFAAIFLLR